MSKLFVDDIVEKTSNHGVQIPGHVVNVTRVQNTGIDTTTPVFTVMEIVA